MCILFQVSYVFIGFLNIRQSWPNLEKPDNFSTIVCVYLMWDAPLFLFNTSPAHCDGVCVLWA